MKTGVIILNYRSSDDTIRLYREIESFPNLRRLVVDNSADPVEASRLKDSIPIGDLLFAPRNLGYAGGNNLGIRTLAGVDTRLKPESRQPQNAEPGRTGTGQPRSDSDIDLIAILNPDISLSQNIFPLLRRCFEINPPLAAAGPRLCIREQDQVIYSDGGIFRQGLFLRPGHLHSGMRVEDVTDEDQPIDYVNGSFIVLRTEAIRQIGGFDEKFFLDSEEADWCRRALAQGWDLEVQTHAVAWQQVSPKEETFSYYFFRSWFLYLHLYDKRGIRPLFIHQMKKIKWLLQTREIPLKRRLRLARSRLQGVLAGTLNW